MAKATTNPGPKTFPTKVRTTFKPTEVISVGETEYLDLLRQNLIFDGTAADAKVAVGEATGDEAPLVAYEPDASAPETKEG